MIAARVPVELGREQAQRLAQQELAKPEYEDARPGLLERVVGWLLERLGDLFARGGAVAPRGWVLLLIVAGLAAVVGLALARRVRAGAGRRDGRALFTGRERSAAEHRAAAEAAVARGAWAEAVRDRLRAIVRELEERAVLDPRPGRTADEAAAEAGRLLPAVAADLREAARLFDEIWYGARPATAEHDRRLREVDAAVAAARPHTPVR